MWLLFYETGVKGDEAWEKVAKATVNGELGTHAEVNPFEDRCEGNVLYDDKHIIIVYTKDFTKKKHVMDIEKKNSSVFEESYGLQTPCLLKNWRVFRKRVEAEARYLYVKLGYRQKGIVNTEQRKIKWSNTMKYIQMQMNSNT